MNPATMVHCHNCPRTFDASVQSHICPHNAIPAPQPQPLTLADVVMKEGSMVPMVIRVLQGRGTYQEEELVLQKINPHILLAIAVANHKPEPALRHGGLGG